MAKYKLVGVWDDFDRNVKIKKVIWPNSRIIQPEKQAILFKANQVLKHRDRGCVVIPYLAYSFVYAVEDDESNSRKNI